MKKTTLACALLCASLLGLSATAHAAPPVTYNFGGVVDFDDLGRGFSSFTGSFTFDAAAVDSIADASTAAYAHPALAPWGITLSFDGGAPFTLNSPFTVLVSNNLAGSDQWGLLGQAGNQAVSLTLTDFNATVFASDALPLPVAGVLLSAFQSANLVWDLPAGSLQGRLTSLNLEPAAPVPEARTVAMMLAGLCTLRLVRRRAPAARQG